MKCTDISALCLLDNLPIVSCDVRHHYVGRNKFQIDRKIRLKTKTSSCWPSFLTSSNDAEETVYIVQSFSLFCIMIILVLWLRWHENSLFDLSIFLLDKLQLSVLSFIIIPQLFVIVSSIYCFIYLVSVFKCKLFELSWLLYISKMEIATTYLGHPTIDCYVRYKNTACPSVTESRFFRVCKLYFDKMKAYNAEIFTECVSLVPLHIQ